MVKNLLPITVLLLGLCTAAQASRVAMASSYGSPSGMFTDCSSSITPVTCSGGTMEYENFGFSGGGNYEVFDIELISAPSNFALTLQGSGDFFADTPGPNDCAGNSDSEFCGFGTFSGTATSILYNPPTSDGTEDSVTFTVTGGQNLQFFVIESGGSSATVTATLTSATPEPRLLPILGLVMLAGILIYRRRLA